MTRKNCPISDCNAVVFEALASKSKETPEHRDIVRVSVKADMCQLMYKEKAHVRPQGKTV